MLSKYPLILKNGLLRTALDMKISNVEKAMKRAWLVLPLHILLGRGVASPSCWVSYKENRIEFWPQSGVYFIQENIDLHPFRKKQQPSNMQEDTVQPTPFPPIV